MESIGKLVTGFIAIIVVTLMNGLVFSQLWLWFIVSTFNVIPLSLVQAIGLSFVIGFFTVHSIQKTEEDLLEIFIRAIVSSLLFLFVGWIIHLFM